jgi:hypothetical protein
MTEQIINFLNGFNFQTILSMGIIVWYFSKDLKTSLETKIDNLDKDLQKMNTRVSHLEGTVYGVGIYKEK